MLAVAKQLSHSVPFRSLALSSGDQSMQRKALESGVDLVVCTPGRLRKMHSRGQVFYSAVHTVVVDEADTMIEDFGQEVKPTLQALAEKQLVLAGATVTPALRRTLEAKFEELDLITAQSLHRPPDRLKHFFERCYIHHPCHGNIAAGGKPLKR